MLVFHSGFTRLYSFKMSKLSAAIMLLVLAFVVCGYADLHAQEPAPKSQEISEEDGQPVLIKHLPDYENFQAGAVFGTDKRELEKALGGKPVLSSLEFPFGTEFVTAQYPQGRLLIIEYTNPQSSIEADGRILQHIASSPEPGLVYRRIGNYNAFVFGAADEVAANDLLGQIQYQKTVQWLGEDPYILKRLERYMVTQSRDIMISTVLVIVGGLVASILAGIAVGFIFFRFRDHKRGTRTAYSDAGGLTRLNLDGLSE